MIIFSDAMKGSSSMSREWIRAGYTTSPETIFKRVIMIESAERNISGIVIRLMAESSRVRLRNQRSANVLQEE